MENKLRQHLNLKMGSSQNKDPLLFIYITLNKRYYYAGETVEGAVHVDCKANRPYTQLCLRIHGSQKVHWSQNHNNVYVEYNNFKDTYLELLPLAQFQSGISTGQYTFPFSFLLPSTLPASFQLESHNYIRYTLTAFFPSVDSKAAVPQFKRPLHIREPPRTIQQGFKLQSLVQAKCCGCCCVCGETDLTFESSAAVLMYNETFLARGKVDNTMGTTDIKSFKVVLRQTIKRISDWGNVHQTDDHEFVLYSCPNPVPVGTSLPFDIQIKVPNEALGYTAIGSIIYRAYFLELVAEVNCCYSNPRVSKHIIFNTSVQPPVDEEEMTKAPQGWRPVVQPPVSFLNLKPYIYVPNPLIDVSNQLSLPNQNMASMNSNANPYASPSNNHLIH